MFGLFRTISGKYAKFHSRFQRELELLPYILGLAVIIKGFITGSISIIFNDHELFPYAGGIIIGICVIGIVQYIRGRKA